MYEMTLDTNPKRLNHTQTKYSFICDQNGKKKRTKSNLFYAMLATCTKLHKLHDFDVHNFMERKK
jgi:hypothetical protein